MSKSLVIVLTGVTRGLGRALLDEFVRLGHIVAGCGRSSSDIIQIHKKYAEPHIFDVVDVSVDAMVKNWAEKVLLKLGPPDYLINCAAVINKNAPLWKISDSEFSLVIDVNVKGTANMIRHFVPSMVKRNLGVIVNFSSGWGRTTDAEVAPYCCSKWAIEGLTQAFAQELPSGMAAVALNPGIINTDMLKSCFGENASKYPEPQDWARKAAPYILSLNAVNNGQSLTVPFK
jgi:NAD(P)-dependent dehydrogenase (short-subunit alcohol dehydrogenase family)